MKDKSLFKERQINISARKIALRSADKSRQQTEPEFAKFILKRVRESNHRAAWAFEPAVLFGRKKWVIQYLGVAGRGQCVSNLPAKALSSG